MLVEFGLLHDIDAPLDTTIGQLLTDVKARMEMTPHCYVFTAPPGTHILGDEALPLQLWKLRNLGKARLDASVHITPSTVPHTTTLAQLTSPAQPHHRYFVNAEASIEPGYGGSEEMRLVLHVSECCLAARSNEVFADEFAWILVCVTDISYRKVPYDGKRHRQCHSSRLASLFPSDALGGRDPDYTSGGEDDDDDDDDDDDAMSQDSIPETVLVPATPPRIATPPVDAPLRELGSSMLQPTLARSASSIVVRYFPASIWQPDSPWQGSSRPTRTTIRLTSLPGAVYRLATPPRELVPSLVVEGGPDVAGLAIIFKALLAKACVEQDFTRILHPDRHFHMYVLVFVSSLLEFYDLTSFSDLKMPHLAHCRSVQVLSERFCRTCSRLTEPSLTYISPPVLTTAALS